MGIPAGLLPERVRVLLNSILSGRNGVEVGDVRIHSGDGAPAFAAPVGTLYLRKNGGAGSTLYVKEVGTDASGWTAK